MSARSRFEQSLVDFGKQIGESLEFDDARTCVFELSDDHECLLAMAEDGEAVAFCVNVAPVLLADRESLFRHLLIMNYRDEATEGTALGLTDDGEEIVLRHTRSADGLESDVIERMVGNLALLADRLGAELVAWQQNAAQGADDSAPIDATDTTANPPPSILPDFA